MLLIKYDKIDSTQDLARELSSKIYGDFVVMADEQLSGRGRRVRDWYSPKGGLWCTFCIKKINLEPEKLSQKVAKIICKVLREETDKNFEIKPPNDILYHGKKVCGILIENLKKRTLIGIGINTNLKKEIFPKNLREKIDTLYEITGKFYDNLAIVEKIYDIICRELLS